MKGLRRPEIRHLDLVTAGAVFASALLLYLATLAPTVLWGDDAYYQHAVYEGVLRRDAGGHWLWFQIARWFIQLPWGDVAYRVNLLSAVAGAVTILFLYLAAQGAGLSRLSALVACLSLAISHTFWAHTARAEVYTVFTALMALQLCLWWAWQPQRLWPIVLSALLWGAALLGHQMALLLLPALACLLWLRRTWLNRWQWLLLAVAFACGLLPFVGLMQWQAGGRSLLTVVRLYFTHYGIDYGHFMFDFSLSKLPRDLAVWAGFLGLQFVGVAGLLGVWGAISILRRKPWPVPGLTTLVLYATCVVFAFSYHVTDQYVFYLPSYLTFSLLAGWGWQAVSESRFLQRDHLRLGILLLLVIVPVLTYATLPRLMSTMNINPLGIRTLAGRDPYRFFIWPPKNGETGARQFGESALRSLPENSALLSDYTPFETLRYLQVIEGLRTDVLLIDVASGKNLDVIVKRLPAQKPIFLAGNDPKYYDVNSLPGSIEPFGPIYRFRPAAPH